MSEKAEGGLIDTSNPMWEKSERAARKYCGSYGYEQEPMKLACIIYDAICEPAPALQSLSPEREAVIDVDWLANVIRVNSGDHLNPIGAGALAEKIVEAIRALKPAAGNDGRAGLVERLEDAAEHVDTEDEEHRQLLREAAAALSGGRV